MDTTRIRIRIEGVTPLLQNRYPLTVEDASTTKRGKKEDVETKLYRDECEGDRIYQPMEHLIASMRDAGAKFRIPGQGKSTYKKTIASGTVQIHPERIPHLNQEWKIDRRAVVIRGQGRIPRERPLFEDWALEFEAELDNEEIRRPRSRDPGLCGTLRWDRRFSPIEQRPVRKIYRDGVQRGLVRGVVWPGLARRGLARRGKARQGFPYVIIAPEMKIKVRIGTARRGAAGRGVVRRGKVFHAPSSFRN